MGRYRSVCFGFSFMTPKSDIVMKVFGEGNNREMEVKIGELLAVSPPEVAKIDLDPPENTSRSTMRRDDTGNVHW
jgi:hypothetical protein